MPFFWPKIMKQGSDNFRDSAIIDVLNYIKSAAIKIYIYEPQIKDKLFMGTEVMQDLEEFKTKASIIITNRFSKDLEDVKEKTYTRDVYGEN